LQSTPQHVKEGFKHLGPKVFLLEARVNRVTGYSPAADTVIVQLRAHVILL